MVERMDPCKSQVELKKLGVGYRLGCRGEKTRLGGTANKNFVIGRRKSNQLHVFKGKNQWSSPSSPNKFKPGEQRGPPPPIFEKGKESRYRQKRKSQKSGFEQKSCKRLNPGGT